MKLAFAGLFACLALAQMEILARAIMGIRALNVILPLVKESVLMIPLFAPAMELAVRLTIVNVVTLILAQIAQHLLKQHRAMACLRTIPMFALDMARVWVKTNANAKLDFRVAIVNPLVAMARRPIFAVIMVFALV